MTDYKNVVHELNILKKRVKELEKIVDSQKAKVKSLRHSNNIATEAANYYRRLYESGEK